MESETNQPSAEEAYSRPVAHEVPHQPQHAKHTKNRGPKGVVLIIVLLVLIAGLGAGCWHMRADHEGVDPKSINTSEFQSLFLTNGQVYFGKLSDLGKKYVTMTDIYYLQVQQGQTLQSGSTATNSTSSKISLAKLGSELHGPEDKMFVASDQVLFWENMKPDSKVSQAIAKFQTK